MFQAYRDHGVKMPPLILYIKNSLLVVCYIVFIEFCSFFIFCFILYIFILVIHFLFDFSANPIFLEKVLSQESQDYE